MIGSASSVDCIVSCRFWLPHVHELHKIALDRNRFVATEQTHPDDEEKRHGKGRREGRQGDDEHRVSPGPADGRTLPPAGYWSPNRRSPESGVIVEKRFQAQVQGDRQVASERDLPPAGSEAAFRLGGGASTAGAYGNGENLVDLPRDRLWTVQDVASYLVVSRSWVYKAAEDGRLLRARGLGWQLRFHPADIYAFARGEARSGATMLRLPKKEGG